MYVADRAAWRADLLKYVSLTRFTGLTIRDAPQPQGAEGFVAFTADIAQGDRAGQIVEHSRFVLRDGHWLYHGAIA